MATTARTRRAPPAHEVTMISVPDQTPTYVRDAHETAKKLGGTLASFDAVTMNVVELQKAKTNYVLAVDPKNMPKEAGWHRVDRDTENNRITFVSITGTAATELIGARKEFDVLYVNQSAVDAANEGRPVVLGALPVNWDGRCLDASGWPDDRVALVALSSPSQADSAAAAPQNGAASNSTPKETIRAAKREYTSKIEKNPAIDAGAFPASRHS